MKQASFVYCLAIPRGAAGKIKSIYKLNITTQNANALAILGYAAAAIMCEKLP